MTVDAGWSVLSGSLRHFTSNLMSTLSIIKSRSSSVIIITIEHKITECAVGLNVQCGSVVM